MVLYKHLLILTHWGLFLLPGWLRLPTFLRPRMEVEFRNRHFYAVEAVEGIVMQLFLLEVRKRCFAPSIVWLHDGFWIDKQVDDGVLVAAERHVRALLFPLSEEGEPLFRIMDLTEARDRILQTCTCSPFTPLFLTSQYGSYLSGSSNRCHTRQLPVAKFTHKERVLSERCLPTLIGLESVLGSFGSSW